MNLDTLAAINPTSNNHHDDKVRALALTAVRVDGLALKHLSTALRADVEVVQAAVRQNGHALAWASPTLQACPTTVSLAIQSQQPFSYRLAVPALQHNLELVLQAVRADGRVLEFVVPPLKYQRQVIQAAVAQNGVALRFVLDQYNYLDADALVQMAVRSNGYALAILPAAWQADRSTVMQAVQQAGQALEFAHETLQNDPQVALAAVTQNGYALEWVGPALQQSCRQLVHTAVKQNGSALWLAADVWKSDLEIVTTALRQGKFPLAFVHESIRNHSAVWDALLRGTDLLGRDVHRLLQTWRSNNELAWCQTLIQCEVMYGRVNTLFPTANERLAETKKCLVDGDKNEQCTDDNDSDDDEKRAAQLFRCYAEQVWKRNNWERIWLLRHSFRIMLSSPRPDYSNNTKLTHHHHADVQRTILEFAGLPQDFCHAKQLVYWSPVLGALEARGVDWRTTVCSVVDTHDDDEPQSL
eukprot:scaffold8050_cov180-Amphora_coffeaeformis.AAC.5